MLTISWKVAIKKTKRKQVTRMEITFFVVFLDKTKQNKKSFPDCWLSPERKFVFVKSAKWSRSQLLVSLEAADVFR